MAGAALVYECGGEPLIGGVIGSLAGVVFALAVAGEMPAGWLTFPPHEDESAESL